MLITSYWLNLFLNKQTIQDAGRGSKEYVLQTKFCTQLEASHLLFPLAIYTLNEILSNALQMFLCHRARQEASCVTCSE